MNQNQQDQIQLTVEQEFAISQFPLLVQKLTEDQAKKMLVDFHESMIRREAEVRWLLRKSGAGVIQLITKRAIQPLQQMLDLVLGFVVFLFICNGALVLFVLALAGLILMQIRDEFCKR